ncbi:hypothetical protein AALG83_04000 [Christensenellaceae bacterium 44-20]
MPKVKITFPKTPTPGKMFIANMEKYRSLNDKDDQELAIAGRMSISTYYVRRKRPETLRLYEMIGISKALGVSLASMIEEKPV